MPRFVEMGSTSNLSNLVIEIAEPIRQFVFCQHGKYVKCALLLDVKTQRNFRDRINVMNGFTF